MDVDDSGEFGDLSKWSEEEIAALMRILPENKTPEGNFFRFMDNDNDTEDTAQRLADSHKGGISYIEIANEGMDILRKKAEELGYSFGDIEQSLKSHTLTEDYPDVTDFISKLESVLRYEHHIQVSGSRDDWEEIFGK